MTVQYRPDGKLNIELWSVVTILKHVFFIALLYTAKMSSKVQPPNSPASLTTLLQEDLEMADKCPKIVYKWYKNSRLNKGFLALYPNGFRHMRWRQLLRDINSFSSFPNDIQLVVNDFP